jgi:cytochrome oxidase Cu insertion factor (SCO1/SenC/PrrC family)
MIARMIARILIALFFFAVGLAPARAQSADASAPRASPVATGDMAPDFTLEDQNGRKLTLSEERGKRPVVLVFYRGYW